MSKFHLVGLCGPDADGRAAVAEILRVHGGFRRLSLLETLHAEIREGFNMTPAVFDALDPSKPLVELAFARCLNSGFVGAAARQLAIAEPDVSLTSQISRPRSRAEIVQLWDRAYRFGADPSYWSRQLVARIAYYRGDLHETRFVVDDVRFENEADVIRRAGGLVWQLRAQDQLAEAPEWADVNLVTPTDRQLLLELVLGRYWARDAGLASVRVECAA